MPTPKPPYPAAFREQIVELARAGRSLKQLSREFGVSTTTIRAWVLRADGQPDRPAAGVSSLVSPSSVQSQEIAELRRQLRQVQMERGILAKATAWFAGKSERTSTMSSNS